MEKYYEIIMKNGLSVIAFTNMDGLCEFSINGNEFSIYSGEEDWNGEKVNLSVSAERAVVPGKDQTEVLIDHQFTVLSIRSLNLKKLKGSKKTEIEKSKTIRKARTGEERRRSYTCGANYFCAHQGGIKTPQGWLIGSL